jgi:hypothetical protein
MNRSGVSNPMFHTDLIQKNDDTTRFSQLGAEVKIHEVNEQTFVESANMLESSDLKKASGSNQVSLEN